MENYKLELMQEFENIQYQKMFEINIVEDFEAEPEYYLFHLDIDEKGIYAGSVTNCGFYAINGLFVEWDEYYSLDEHLFLLHEYCREWAAEDFEKSLEEK